MRRFRGVLKGGVAALVVGAHLALGQVAGETLRWHRELAPAMAEARQSGKVILTFFADAKSEVSARGWASLCHGRIEPLIRTSCVPVLVDCDSQKALAAQLGVAEPGVAVLYDSKGAALRLVAAREVADLQGLEELLRSLPGVGGTRGTASVVPVVQVTPAASPVVSPVPAPDPVAPPQVAGGEKGAPGGEKPPPAAAGDAFANAIPAERVGRELLGREVAVTGKVFQFEGPTGPRTPYVITLVQRKVDPVQVAYWDEVARQLHAGGAVPGNGRTVSVKGKLTEFRGRLQIKLNDIHQIRIQ